MFIITILSLTLIATTFAQKDVCSSSTTPKSCATNTNANCGWIVPSPGAEGSCQTCNVRCLSPDLQKYAADNNCPNGAASLKDCCSAGCTFAPPPCSSLTSAKQCSTDNRPCSWFEGTQKCGDCRYVKCATPAPCGKGLIAVKTGCCTQDCVKPTTTAPPATTAAPQCSDLTSSKHCTSTGCSWFDGPQKCGDCRYVKCALPAPCEKGLITVKTGCCTQDCVKPTTTAPPTATTVTATPPTCDSLTSLKQCLYNKGCSWFEGSQKCGDCRYVRCATPAPCEKGLVAVKTGCCTQVCVKPTSSPSPTLPPAQCSDLTHKQCVNDPRPCSWFDGPQKCGDCRYVKCAAPAPCEKGLVAVKTGCCSQDCVKPTSSPSPTLPPTFPAQCSDFSYKQCITDRRPCSWFEGSQKCGDCRYVKCATPAPCEKGLVAVKTGCCSQDCVKPTSSPSPTLPPIGVCPVTKEADVCEKQGCSFFEANQQGNYCQDCRLVKCAVKACEAGLVAIRRGCCDVDCVKPTSSPSPTLPPIAQECPKTKDAGLCEKHGCSFFAANENSHYCQDCRLVKCAVKECAKGQKTVRRGCCDTLCIDVTRAAPTATLPPVKVRATVVVRSDSDLATVRGEIADALKKRDPLLRIDEIRANGDGSYNVSVTSSQGEKDEALELEVKKALADENIVVEDAQVTDTAESSASTLVASSSLIALFALLN